MTCPRCKLDLAGKLNHATEADCLRHLVPRYHATARKLRLSIGQLAQQREREKQKIHLTAPGLQKRVVALEAVIRRAEEARQRYDYLVSELTRLTARVDALEGKRERRAA
jgi:hypothetical protein